MRCIAGGEEAKAEAFKASWQTGAPLVGDEGAKGWAAWESKQGVHQHSPAPNGASTPNAAAVRQEQKGGWGEWVPLMPDTPQEPKATPALEAEAAAETAADEVSLPVQQW